MAILKMYNRPKPNFERLERLVDDAKKKQMEEKHKKDKHKFNLGSRDGTPNSGSRIGELYSDVVRVSHFLIALLESATIFRPTVNS